MKEINVSKLNEPYRARATRQELQPKRKKMGIHTRLLVRSINGYRTYYVWTHVYVTPKTVIKRKANACEWWDGIAGKQGACNEDGCRFALRVTTNTCGAHTLGFLKRECFFFLSFLVLFCAFIWYVCKTNAYAMILWAAYGWCRA